MKPPEDGWKAARAVAKWLPESLELMALKQINKGQKEYDLWMSGLTDQVIEATDDVLKGAWLRKLFFWISISLAFATGYVCGSLI